MASGGVAIAGNQIEGRETPGSVDTLIALSDFEKFLVRFARRRIVMAIQKLGVGLKRVRRAVLRASFQKFARSGWVAF